jgi:hypothetical protein
MGSGDPENMPTGEGSYTGLVRRLDVEERRARLGLRHRLAEPAPDPIEVTRSLVALHSSDPTTVFLSMWARVAGFETEDLEQLLYDDRALVRFYGMRRTLWVIERDMVPLVHNSSTRSIGEKDRRRSIKILEDGGITNDGSAWLAEVEPKTLAVIAEQGEVLARDLTRQIPELQDKIEYYNKEGKLMGTTGLTTRVLNQLALESRVVRAKPTGTWISGQYRWAAMDEWLGGPIEKLTVRAASARLLDRWLHAFGPATETDIRWWTGWPVKQVREAIADVEATEVGLEDGVGYLASGDVEPVDRPEHWVALLPSLDPTTMGWKERDWYMGDHEAELFDRNGNAGPTIWVDGRVVGGWAKRKDGHLAHELLEEVDSETEDLIEDRIAELQDWFGEVTITPRFRSHHDRKLAP